MNKELLDKLNNFKKLKDKLSEKKTKLNLIEKELKIQEEELAQELSALGCGLSVGGFAFKVKQSETYGLISSNHIDERKEFFKWVDKVHEKKDFYISKINISHMTLKKMIEGAVEGNLLKEGELPKGISVVNKKLKLQINKTK